MVTLFLPLAWASLMVAANRDQHAGPRGQSGAPRVATGGFGQPGRGPGTSLAVSGPSCIAQGRGGLTHPRHSGGRGGQQDRGRPRSRRHRAPQRHSHRRAGSPVRRSRPGRLRGGVAMERYWVTGPRPRAPPPRPGPGPSSPRSQKVPLQPAGQVQAPLTWSQAAPCSHWHRRPQPGPKWPWGHAETHSPGPLSAGGPRG